MFFLRNVLDYIKQNKLFFVFVACKLSFLFLATNFSLLNNYPEESFSGDARNYIRASKNFVETGSYFFPEFKDNEAYYTCRMPGMATILVPLLSFFSVSTSFKLFVILQTLLLSLACYLLYLLFCDQIKNKIARVLFFIFVSVGSYLNNFIDVALSETIACSLIIFILYILLMQKNNSYKTIILLGFLATWLVFLRPFMVVFLPFISLYILFQKDFSVDEFKKNKNFFLVFSCIFLLAISAWTYRNYKLTNKFIPHEYSVRTDKIHWLRECSLPLIKFITNFGGNYYKGSDSHLLWFYPEKTLHKYKRPSFDIFPDEIKNSKVLRDSLKKVQQLTIAICSLPRGSLSRKPLFAEFEKTLNFVNQKYMSDKGFLHILKKRKKTAILFMYQSTFVTNNAIDNFLLKSIYILVNLICNITFITFSILFCTFLFFKINKNYLLLVIPSIAILLIFILYFAIHENRELYCLLPPFIMAGANAYKNFSGNLYFKKAITFVIVPIILLLSVYTAYIII